MTALAEELRAELDARPITPTAHAEATVRAVLYNLEAESRRAFERVAVEDRELHGRLLADVQRQQTERAAVAAMRRTLDEAMRALGYDEDETAEALASVEPAPWSDGELHLAFRGPPRVVQYFDAISDGDLRLADLIGGVVIDVGQMR